MQLKTLASASLDLIWMGHETKRAIQIKHIYKVKISIIQV